MSTPGAASRAADALRDAVASGVFPAAVAEVGYSNAAIWQHAAGTLTFESAKPTTLDTIFDLASLTKPLATGSLALQQCAAGVLTLDTPLARVFPDWYGADREAATVRDLLEHCSGLPARLLNRPATSRREFEYDICTMPLDYPLRARSIYSDLDFVLLGFLIADLAGQSLPELFRQLLEAAGLRPTSDARTYLAYGAPTSDRSHVAPTDPLAGDPRSGRRLVGEVHDDYAAALGGAAGHAGLFGTAAGVGAFARLALRGARGDDSLVPPFSREWMTLARQRSRVPGSSRALGWDTMLSTSSCGTRMSATAFGHVGFTGTSIWIDPERDRYFVLLTNRACGGGTSEHMQLIRRSFHDTLADL